MRVLIACEFSGVVRRAFRALGHNAWSCDLLPAEDGSRHHFECDVRTVLDSIGSGYTTRHNEMVPSEWDLMIAHPPCTLLTRAGARWWKGREDEQDEALGLVRTLFRAPIPRIAIENPPGAIGTRIRPANQYIQPWQFGHPEVKQTGLWLVGLPNLTPTKDVSEEMRGLSRKERERVHFAAPGPNRWKVRSMTYQGIAEAMADQWGSAHPVWICRGCNQATPQDHVCSTPFQGLER